MAVEMGGRLDRRDRQVDLVAGEQGAERDARCQAHAPEQHDDHDPPEHALNVLRSSASRYGWNERRENEHNWKLWQSQHWHRD
jgi:hypothetical protein